MIDHSLDIFLLLRKLIHWSAVDRKVYDNTLTMLTNVYRENNELRRRLAALEQLASSWSGSAESHTAIREARKALRAGIGRVWL